MKLIDLTGKTFGKWTVLGTAANKTTKKVAWLCRCICGVEKNVIGQSLTTNGSSGCSECQRKISATKRTINLIGQKFHTLTVIEKSNTINKKIHWIAKCDCGNIISVNGSSLKSGNTKSCGCMTIMWQNESKSKREYKRKYDPHIASAKRIFRGYKDGDLSFNQFFELSQLPCHYCGELPSNKYNYFIKETIGKGVSLKSIEEGYFIYNGLDRINNSQNHNLDNVVPCCKHCNLAKRDRNYNDFINWINRAAEHLKTKRT